MAGQKTLAQFCAAFRNFTDRQDGVQLVRLLDPDRGKIPQLNSEGEIQAFASREGGDYGDVLSLYLSCLLAQNRGDSTKELECACTALKTWVTRYIEVEGFGLWMMPLLMYLSVVARGLATQLDKAKRSESGNEGCMKKLLEIHRDLFQKIAREKTKRPGCVWVVSEVLRAYFKLGQVSQCSFILGSLTQSMGRDGFNPTELPKSIAVTFHFFWGRHSVFEHDLQKADERLTWAFENCPKRSKVNRRQILLYLVPCRLGRGILPTQDLLQTYDLVMFVDIVRAIREGNVRLFNERMQEYAADFIKMGTYLLMMKLKFMVLRNLCKLVHREVRRRMGDPDATKMDFAPFEHALRWQDGCDADESVCLLSSLIVQSAMKGYLSHEHKKIVFAKGKPFPGPSEWKL